MTRMLWTEPLRRAQGALTGTEWNPRAVENGTVQEPISTESKISDWKYENLYLLSTVASANVESLNLRDA